jgi:predicted RNase H-like HicB family nuclease
MVSHFYSVVISRDADGDYIASVPELPGCHTQADDLDTLRGNVKEAIEAYLGEEALPLEPQVQFIGVEQIAV